MNRVEDDQTLEDIVNKPNQTLLEQMKAKYEDELNTMRAKHEDQTKAIETIYKNNLDRNTFDQINNKVRNLSLTVDSQPIVSTHSTQKSDSLDLTLIDSFAGEYKFSNVYNPVENLKEYVDACFLNPINQHYFSIVQSSGEGKSKLVNEFLKCDKYVPLYVCLRDSDGTGFPKCCLHRDSILNAFETEKMCFDFMIRALIVSLGYVADNPDFRKNIVSDYNKNNSFWMEVLQCTLVDLDKVSIQRKYFVFVVDEAKVLIKRNSAESDKNGVLNLFRVLRRTINKLVLNKVKIMLILLDTCGTIANFSFPVGCELSLRKVNQEVAPLHHPFIWVSVPDIFYHPSTAKSQMLLLWNSFVKDSYLKAIFVAGRPLWNSYIQEPLNCVIEVAQFKIIGGASSDILTEKSDSSFVKGCALAIWCSLCSISFKPDCVVSSGLVALHLAHLIAIHKDRHSCLISYQSEPVVSESIFKLFRCEVYFKKSLFRFSENLLQSCISTGDRGELCTRVLLIIFRYKSWIFNNSHEEYISSFRITLGNFLTSFCVPDLKPKEFDESKTDMLTSFVLNFTHFVPIVLDCSKIDQNYLMDAFVRCQAFVLSPGTPGADLAFPVYNFEKSEIGLVLIQCKNVQASGNQQSVEMQKLLNLLTTSIAFPSSNLECKTFGIVFQLGHKAPFCSFHEKSAVITRSKNKSKKLRFFASFGNLDSFALTEDEIFHLKLILDRSSEYGASSKWIGEGFPPNLQQKIFYYLKYGLDNEINE